MPEGDFGFRFHNNCDECGFVERSWSWFIRSTALCFVRVHANQKWIQLQVRCCSVTFFIEIVNSFSIASTVIQRAPKCNAMKVLKFWIEELHTRNSFWMANWDSWQTTNTNTQSTTATTKMDATLQLTILLLIEYRRMLWNHWLDDFYYDNGWVW